MIIKKAIFFIGTAAIIACTTPAHAAKRSKLKACIWSYEGLVDYDIAVKGCKKGYLPGLTERERAAIWELPDWQMRAFASALTAQAQGKARR